jgi:hypothetical protein
VEDEALGTLSAKTLKARLDAVPVLDLARDQPGTTYLSPLSLNIKKNLPPPRELRSGADPYHSASFQVKS